MAQMIEGVEYVTATEAAALKGVRRSTIHKAITDARLPALRVGRMQLIRSIDLAAYEPGSYNGALGRSTVRRGPGRGAKQEVEN